ncbi:MAG TPA: 50S ribosomal protein L20 [Flavobacteriales bacterium]|jgi:large subunit ribosomal protein L20|nr:50S ribosomal protein L20 [Flavobacteriales bacterium]HPH83112.1 50S ribosomal protein L20 [Flavobacteriales bacterium]
MPRSVNHVASRARRKKILNQTKGYWGARKNVFTIAKNILEKGLTYAYRDRKTKKRNFRGLWIQRINAGVRQHGMSYSEFMGKIHAKNIQINRKVLADLAMNNPEAFKAICDAVK